VAKGGGVVAQDAATSVVYGMPKAVAEQNLCKAILPLRDIGRYLTAQIDRGS
jgi:chemotaxis response regulator CheB